MAREHDRQLAGAVRAAADGASGVAVLVGGSLDREDPGLLGSIAPAAGPGGAMAAVAPDRSVEAAGGAAGAAHVGPRTVVWLNEAQFYLDVPGGAGERVAAGLRGLLRESGRAPVLVLATLWLQFWARS